MTHSALILNLYAYASNNPLRYVDPDGKDLKIGECAGGTVTTCYGKLVSGLKKEDQTAVKLVTGDAKNGCGKGSYCVTVDPNRKSDSKNFQALQGIVNDHSHTAVLNVLGAFEPYSSVSATGMTAGKMTYGTMSATLGYPLAQGQDSLYGFTLFPRDSGANAPWSTTGDTQVLINLDQSWLGIVESIHHELRHVYLGDFGRMATGGRSRKSKGRQGNSRSRRGGSAKYYTLEG